MCSYCDRDDGHDWDHCQERLEDKFGSGTADLRDTESTDENSHASATLETLRNADDADLETAGIETDEDEKSYLEPVNGIAESISYPEAGEEVTLRGTGETAEVERVDRRRNFPIILKADHPYRSVRKRTLVEYSRRVDDDEDDRELRCDGAGFEHTTHAASFSCDDCDDFELEKSYSGIAGTPGEEEYDRIQAPETCPACGGTVTRDDIATDGGKVAPGAVEKKDGTLSVDDLRDENRVFVREKIEETLAEYFEPLEPDLTVEAVYVCGSFASGEARRTFSDLDVRVVVDGDVQPVNAKQMGSTIRTAVTGQLPEDRLFGYVDAQVYPLRADAADVDDLPRLDPRPNRQPRATTEDHQ